MIRLPDGFTVQGVSNLADGKLRAAVLHSHFRPNGAWHEFWAEYAQFMGSVVYDGERDLFVRSPDGRGASACTIWFDPVNAVGLFEPVATHPDFQGRGLGKAVMAEGMRRMQAAGMRRAIVGFDPNNLAAMPGRFMDIVLYGCGVGVVLLLLSRPLARLMGNVR